MLLTDMLKYCTLAVGVVLHYMFFFYFWIHQKKKKEHPRSHQSLNNDD